MQNVKVNISENVRISRYRNVNEVKYGTKWNYRITSFKHSMWKKSWNVIPAYEIMIRSYINSEESWTFASKNKMKLTATHQVVFSTLFQEKVSNNWTFFCEKKNWRKKNIHAIQQINNSTHHAPTISYGCHFWKVKC